MTTRYTNKLLKKYGYDLSPEEKHGLKLTGFDDEITVHLQVTRHLMQLSKFATLAPLLPLMLSIKGDPYSLEKYFPFEPFFRTRISRKTLLIAGRQISKCGVLGYSGDMNIYLHNGRCVRYADIKIGDRVLSIDETTYKVVESEVIAIQTNPSKPCYRIKTRRGAVLEYANTHPLYTQHGWTRTDKLKVKDRLAHTAIGGAFGKKKQDRTRVRLTAYMIGDGGMTGQTWTFTKTKVSPVFKEVWEFTQGQARREDRTDRCASICFHKAHPVYDWLTEDGLAGKYSQEKFIPDWVFDLSRKQTIDFLEALWATGGMIKADSIKPTISYSSASRRLVNQIKSLLLKFRIPVTIKTWPAGYKKDSGEYVKCQDTHVLRVETRRGWETFMETFNVPGKPPVDIRDVPSNNNRDTVPYETRELIKAISGTGTRGSGPSLSDVKLRPSPKYAMTYSKLAEYLDWFREHRADHPRLWELERLMDGDIEWDEIESIEAIGDKECIDIEVKDTHNYIVDGILSHNSTSLAAKAVVQCQGTPFYSILCITPFFEMIRRFSNNYVKPFIELSPVKELMIGKSTTSSVLQKSFKNNSQILFSFALESADRVRGISANQLVFDEVQDMRLDVIPVILEVMSGAPNGGVEQYAGTPKSMENAIQALKVDSSQAEYVVKCVRGGCGYWNVPSLARDLEAMTGPYRDDISESRPGLLCAKCQQPINPKLHGRWIHAYPERRWKFAGYHLPQHIFPLHYGNPEKWQILLNKRDGKGNTPTHVYHNEVCGESSDSGARMITETDLKNACILPWPNKIEQARDHKQSYKYRLLSADWGGGGKKRTSYTKYAVMGIRNDGRIDVIYGLQSMSPHDHIHEAKLAMNLLKIFGLPVMSHDYGGAGAIRETLIMQAGFDKRKIIPIAYEGAAKGDIMKYAPPTETRPRGYWQVDRSRSLQLVIECIKNGHIRFFQYDYVDNDEQGLVRDFLALVEENNDTRLTNRYSIIRDPSRSDDFAHAVNIGACTLWQMAGAWPDIAEIHDLQVPSAVADSQKDLDMSAAAMPVLPNTF